jgi:hypothetical protein
MSAGVVQLIAIGAQDEYIVGNPEISFFSSTFKRHANFSQSIEKTNNPWRGEKQFYVQYSI